MIRLPTSRARRGAIRLGAGALLGGAALVATVPLAGCRYEKVEKYKPFFAGMEGVETDAPVVLSDDLKDAYSRPAGPIAEEREDGSVRLISRSVADLMQHVMRTLANDEKELFVEQVLSTQSRDRLLRAGRRPEEAFDDLKANQESIAALFNYLPMGEYSPNGIFRKIGPGQYLLRATGPGTQRLRWTGVDVVQEDGMWRLGWFHP